MDLDLVVLQIKANCPSFNGRVAGAADFAKGLETTVNMPMPAAYVYPLGYTCGENSLDNGLLQYMTQRMAVCVIFDNSGDVRGQDAIDQTEPMMWELFRALLNWRIDSYRAVKGLKADEGRMLDFDRGRLFFQYEFSQEITIDDDDGYHVPDVPLVEIDFTNTGDGNAATTTQRIVFTS